MGAHPKYDWKTLYKEWNRTHGMYLEDFCAQKDIGYTYASRKFKAFDDLEDEKDRRITARILSSALPETAKKLIEHINSSDESISLKAVTTNLNINGFSSQAATLINNNTNVNVQTIPFFASQSEIDPDIRSLFEGSKDVKVLEQ